MLRKKGVWVEKEYPGLQHLIEDMWNTLENAGGVGLAAPQVGVPIQLFLMDSTDTYAALSDGEKQRFPAAAGIRQVFINAQILEKSAGLCVENEGCLSIPGLDADVRRPAEITLKYYDENLSEYIKSFDGPNARIIQHEFDHTQGILYLDHLSPLKRSLMQGKLKKIAAWKFNARYPMK